MFVSYEELSADTPATLRRILEAIGEQRPEARIAEVVDRVNGLNTRRNQAVAGRGAQLLSDDQMDMVRRLAAFYGHVDLSAVGL